MKILALSDIHTDIWFTHAVKPARLKCDDPDESVVYDTLAHIWDFEQIPTNVDGIIVAGDIGNDFLTTTRTLKWLSEKYEKVWVVAGNHDMAVRGGTPSKSNLQFTSSEQKLQAMIDYTLKLPNYDCYLLNGDKRLGIAGCMGMCDFRCAPPSYGLDPFTDWRRNWFDGKHWRYFNQVPGKIVNHYDEMLTNICQKQPKVIVTHFVPYELGVPHEFRNDHWNYVFYFKGEKYFDMLDNDTYWICGHVHGRRQAEILNSKGKKIHIICNPIGYPTERWYHNMCDIVDYTGEKIERTSIKCTHEDFIIKI